MAYSFDFNELIKRIIKYLVMGLVIAIISLLVPRKALNLEEIVVISLTGAASFAVLDTFVPSIGDAMRQGAGPGLGLNLVRFPM